MMFKKDKLKASDIKIVGKDEAFYTEMVDRLEKDNETYKHQIEMNSVVITYCRNELQKLGK